MIVVKSVALISFLVGVVAMGLFMTFVGTTPMADVLASKAKCEANLPRNQNCVLHFIPGEEK